jgi:putative ATPase
MKAPRFYEPTPRGLEGRIGEKLAHLRELDDEYRRALNKIDTKSTKAAK